MRRSLALCGCLASAGVLMIGGCRGGGNAELPGIADLLAGLMPETPSEVARDLFNMHDADRRRRAINLLATAPFGGEPPYVKAYRELVTDPDHTVRAACLRALGNHGAAEDVPRITPYLKDRDRFVRAEAARALQRLHHADAVTPLIKVLEEDAEASVRMACADALGQYPTRPVFLALVAALDDADYAVAKRSQGALYTLTGQAHGGDADKWTAWAEGRGDLFEGRRPYRFPTFADPLTTLQTVRFQETPGDNAPTRPSAP